MAEGCDPAPMWEDTLKVPCPSHPVLGTEEALNPSVRAKGRPGLSSSRGRKEKAIEARQDWQGALPGLHQLPRGPGWTHLKGRWYLLGTFTS